ncbi:hypothetical protein [Actinomyces sp. MRS3W]|uniref:hypothetical protein n=1 Tax=Actinomyces sp. MRS3W TaxID=2800796 RepID=UPI0028FDBA64|nr:hypothetical protein [Actinomyces sp. MRS3W]MDU0348556.1 hypothetical protein [Actinomyces sp. MRS3W]
MNTTTIRPTSVVRRGAVALLALGLALPGIAACDDEVPVTTAPETKQSEPAEPEETDSPEPDPSATAADDAPVTGLNPLTRPSDEPVDEDDAYAGSAYWEFPISVDGWYAYTIDEDGVNEIDSKNSNCLYRSGQYYYDESDYGDAEETQYQADSWADYLEGEFSNVSSEQAVSTAITDSAGNPVEMIMIDAQYTDDDNDMDIRSIIWLRVFSTMETPTMLTLHYTCEVGDYDKTELEDLTSQTHIVNPGPAKMEDGVPSSSSTSKDDMV